MRPGGPPLTRPGGPPTRPGATLMTRPPMGRGAVPVSEIATKMGVLEVTTKSSSSKEKTTSSDEVILFSSCQGPGNMVLVGLHAYMPINCFFPLRRNCPVRPRTVLRAAQPARPGRLCFTAAKKAVPRPSLLTT
jgi:hypothetical protein